MVIAQILLVFFLATGSAVAQTVSSKGVERPIIAVTMGDPSGAGPELTVKALLLESVYEICKPLVIGEGTTMKKAIEKAGGRAKLQIVKSAGEAKGQFGTIDLLDLQNIDFKEVVIGQPSAASGKAGVEYIEKAVKLILAGEARNLATAPISKEATKLAGLGESHTMELLGSLTGTKEYSVMLVAGNLRVAHLTTHVSVKDGCNLVTKERVLSMLKLIHRSFVGWGFKQPRIGVAALNPHAGIGGLMGTEEGNAIVPAVEEAKGSGIRASGPFSPDSIFSRAIGGEFDVVLAMIHDQGHIAVKVYSSSTGTNAATVSIGFPLVRTSSPFGAGFDGADQEIPSPEGLADAIKLAAKLSIGKKL
jgi:4-hydroxythreonine-4-phosphate dehydrogenase